MTHPYKFEVLNVYPGLHLCKIGFSVKTHQNYLAQFLNYSLFSIRKGLGNSVDKLELFSEKKYLKWASFLHWNKKELWNVDFFAQLGILLVKDEDTGYSDQHSYSIFWYSIWLLPQQNFNIQILGMHAWISNGYSFYIQQST